MCTFNALILWCNYIRYLFGCVCVCVCVCVHLYVCVCVHVHAMYAFADVCVCVHVYVSMCVCMCVLVYVCVCVLNDETSPQGSYVHAHHYNYEIFSTVVCGVSEVSLLYINVYFSLVS